MFNPIKRLLIAATAVLALSAPSAAYAYIRVDSGGSSTSAQAQASVAQLPTATQLRRLDVLQATEAKLFATEGGLYSTASRASTVSAVHPVGPSAQAGFQWGDAGIGAAGAVVLLSAGALGSGVIRRRRFAIS